MNNTSGELESVDMSDRDDITNVKHFISLTEDPVSVSLKKQQERRISVDRLYFWYCN